jgi:hypothetical protein
MGSVSHDDRTAEVARRTVTVGLVADPDRDHRPRLHPRRDPDLAAPPGRPGLWPFTVGAGRGQDGTVDPVGIGAGGSSGDGQTSRGDPWALILRALGVIAAGVGVLGFVTLTGGLVLFERFDGVGLPAEHAVAVVPRADLLAVGASSIVPLAVLVGVVVLVLWILLEVDWSRKKTGDGSVETEPKAPGSEGTRRVTALAAAGALVTALYIFLSAGRHVSHPLNIIFLGAIIVGAQRCGCLVGVVCLARSASMG